MEDNQYNEYFCTLCGSGNITFLLFVFADLLFHCNQCHKQFKVEDKEYIYIHQKIAKLKERYP